MQGMGTVYLQHVRRGTEDEAVQAIRACGLGSCIVANATASTPVTHEGMKGSTPMPRRRPRASCLLHACSCATS
eukprot:948708-Pelagomonas_calceolata.AAC.2